MMAIKPNQFWRQQLMPALKIITEDAEKFAKHATSKRAADKVRDLLKTANEIKDGEGIDADRLISLGFWIHQAMLNCAGEPGVSNVVTLRRGRTHFRKQVLGGLKGSIRAHGDAQLRYSQIREAFDKLRTSKPTLSRAEIIRRLAKVHPWSRSTINRAIGSVPH